VTGAPENPVGGRRPLDYGTAASDPRVLLTREGDRATVVIRRPGRRAQAAGTTMATAVVGEGFLVWGIAVFVGWNYVGWLVIPLVMALWVGVFAVAWWQHRRLAEPIVVEVTGTELRFSNLDGDSKDAVLPRGKIYDVKYVSHSGCLVVRMRAMDMAEFLLTPDKREMEEIAGFLREVVGLGETRDDKEGGVV
jgi:hypothetical protein